LKPPPFDYVAPTDLDEALAALADAGEDARVLAGGQSLIPMLNFRLAAPVKLIDLNRVSELSGIERRPDGGLVLGAMTRHRQLERDATIAEYAPLLAEAAPWIAHAPIRTRGTIGGSIAHADPAAELPALLLLLGASVRVARAARDGEAPGRVERTLPLDDFCFGPFFTALEADEVITRIDIPPCGPLEGTAFEEFARRRGDYAIAGAASRMILDEDGTCLHAAVSLINAGPAPALVAGVEEPLVGRPPTEDRLAEAADVASAGCDPAPDMHGSEAYRRHLVRVLVLRTLARAARRAAAGRTPGIETEDG